MAPLTSPMKLSATVGSGQVSGLSSTFELCLQFWPLAGSKQVLACNAWLVRVPLNAATVEFMRM